MVSQDSLGRVLCTDASLRRRSEEARLSAGLPCTSADKRIAKGSSFASLLSASIKSHRPQKIVVLHPGDYRVLQSLRQCCEEQGVELEIREDRDFYCSQERFERWADGRKSLVLEQFYRVMRNRA